MCRDVVSCGTGFVNASAGVRSPSTQLEVTPLPGVMNPESEVSMCRASPNPALWLGPMVKKWSFPHRHCPTSVDLVGHLWAEAGPKWVDLRETSAEISQRSTWADAGPRWVKTRPTPVELKSPGLARSWPTLQIWPNGGRVYPAVCWPSLVRGVAQLRQTSPNVDHSWPNFG